MKLEEIRKIARERFNGAYRVCPNCNGRACAGEMPGIGGVGTGVKGKLKVFVDGGVRSGTDVLKMIALGAEAVLVGRPMAVAAVGGGSEGVALLLNQYAEQLGTAMIYTGCRTLADIGPSVLRINRN